MNCLVFFGNYGSIHHWLPEFGDDHRVLVLDHRSELAGVEHHELFQQVLCLDELRSEGNLLTALQEIHARTPVRAILTPLEPHIELGGKIRDLLHVPGISAQAAKLCRDKAAMKTAAHAAGIPCAVPIPLSDAAHLAELGMQVGFPLIVKPRAGFGTAKTYLLNNEQEAANFSALFAQDLTQFIVERYIVGQEYHVDIFVNASGRILSFTVGKYIHNLLDAVKYHLPIGTNILDEEDYGFKAELVSMIHKLVYQFGVYSTILHLEVFDTDQGLVFGEVACRVGGGPLIGTPIRHMYGFDIWRAFLEVQLQDTISPMQRPTQHYGCVSLGASPGIVSSFTSEAQLEALPGVVEARVRLKEGQEIQGDLENTFTRVGYVVVSGSSAGEVLDHVKEVFNTFEIVAA